MAFFAFIFILPAAAARAQVSTAAAAEVSSGTVPEQAAVTTAAAGAPTLAVQSLVDNSKLYADVNAAGITPEEKARRQAIKDRLSGILDIHEMARLILVKHWDKLTPAQREKYAGLLTKLVEKVAYPQIEKYFNGRIEVKCVGEKPLENGNQEVSTHIIYKEEDLTLNTEFRLHPTDSGWRIYDVVTDGESLLLIYRNQHMGIIRDKGFPELVRLMEKKLNAN